jgi:hypothetical protein
VELKGTVGHAPRRSGERCAVAVTGTALVSLILGLVVILDAVVPVSPAQAASVRVVETCPTGKGSVGSDGVGARASDVEANLNDARAYGESQPKTFSGIGARWSDTTGDPDSWRGVVAVAFTNSLKRHALALAAMVTDPTAIVVCRGRFVRAETERINRELTEFLIRGKGENASIVSTEDGIALTLPGHRRDLADTVLKRYPGALTITLGRFPYPKHTKAAGPATAEIGRPPDGSPCPEVGEESSDAPPHEWGSPRTRRAAVGGSVETQLTLTTSRRSSLPWSGAIEGVVTKRGSLDVVGFTALLLNDTAQSGTVSRSSPSTIRVRVSSFETCDPALGYTLAAGSYDIRLALELDGHAVLTPGIPLVIS